MWIIGCVAGVNTGIIPNYPVFQNTPTSPSYLTSMADTLEELSDAGLRELLTAYSITQPVTPSTRSLLIRKLRRQMSAEPRQDDTARTTLDASAVAAAQLARPEDGTSVQWTALPVLPTMALKQRRW